MGDDDPAVAPAAAAGDAAAAADTRPAVLVIGALGYIGRFLTTYIHNNSLASTLRLVDKQLPQLALLGPEHTAACSSSSFVQADASRPASLSRIFDLPPSPTGSPREFDLVFNCGGETRFSQEDEVYKLRSYQLSISLGTEAARRNVRAFVELSTGNVYGGAGGRTPKKESDKTGKPPSKQAKWKLAAEEDLAKIQGLRLVVLRFPHVYGPYCGRWLGTQLALARVYQSRVPRETMKYLWSPDLRTNTLHVDDTARALWMAAEWRARGPAEENSACVFNVVDRGETSQGIMAGILREVFGIDTGFQNTLTNTFARLNLEHVVDEVNEDVLDEWGELLDGAGKKSGPISPFMEKELLRDIDLSLDGRRFEEVVGFRPIHERITAAEVEAVIESYKRMDWWP